jgi:putative phosphoesterase
MTEAPPDQSNLRVAVISDIHGNIRALDAVLEEVARERPDRILVCGDVASGPFPSDTLDRLMALGERASFICGNADREMVSAYDSQLQFNPKETDPARLFASWCARLIDHKQRDFLASFQTKVVLDVLALGKVLFCHGSPRSDEEIITSLTPEQSLGKLLAGVEEKVVVCGHTHHQFDRQMDRYRVINAGSIGMPYEGKPGAYWVLLGPGVDFRRTEYDVNRAVQQVLATGYPDPSYQENILTPPSSDEVAAYFEKVAAERGERGP